jgi:site-specific DNA-methyltransferase (adenine-specific)
MEAFRIMKPGGYLLSFGGTRTYHRMVCAIEDVGFEIRDCIYWVYGSGFPKSQNIGMLIEKKMGGKGEVIGIGEGVGSKSGETYSKTGGYKEGEIPIKQPTIPEAKEWDGWGTALKPAHEPIVVARKPLSQRTVAENVLKYGTGGYNIDECRISYQESGEDERLGTERVWHNRQRNDVNIYGGGKGIPQCDLTSNPKGRFPANLIWTCRCETDKHEDNTCPYHEFAKAGESTSCPTKRNRTTLGSFGMPNDNTPEYSDSGTPARFFYCAKASTSERNIGCEELPNKEVFRAGHGNQEEDEISVRFRTQTKNIHPTVKPISLMEYLVKLVTKKDAVVLDPFMGSGTTGIACANVERKFIGIEKDEEYFKIAEKRVGVTEKLVLEGKKQKTLFGDDWA